MSDIFQVLGRDHAEVRSMLDQLESSRPERQPPLPEQASERHKLVQHLVVEESKHEAVEEMYFWPAVRESVPDGDDLANTATSQETEGKKLLETLDSADPHDAEFETLLAKFISAGRHHIHFEETQVWPGLRKSLDAQKLDELGAQVDEAKATAPTRPHPATPPKPGVLKTIGAAAAIADRARDAATGRD
ncbi:MAG: hemerythrin domain-containing protein [Actinomycetota bacterium]|nr:hemerythrin domain-containing protein [Actinomycetota bacterium]